MILIKDRHRPFIQGLQIHRRSGKYDTYKGSTQRPFKIASNFCMWEI